MRSIPLCLILAAAFYLTANSAEARDRFTVGNWSGGSYVDDNGQFSHCSMSAAYVGGTNLLFVIMSDGRFYLGLSNDAWSLTDRETYRVRYWVDRDRPRRVDAKAISDRLVVFDPPSRDWAFDRLRRGYVLNIETQRDKMAFRLDGTFVALRRLARCVSNELAANRGTGRPAAEGASNPFENGSDTERAELRVEAVTVAANILARSGMRDFELLDADKAPELLGEGFHAYWRSEAIYGGLVILPDYDDSLEELASRAIGIVAGNCNGEFESGLRRNASVTQPRSIRFFVSCRGQTS